MSVEHRYCCNRCGNVILEARTRLVAESGPLRAAGLAEMDLCETCCQAVLDLIRSGAAQPAGSAG
jgi:hypothetical protein